MATIVNFMSGLPIWFWAVSGLFGLMLLALVAFDEIKTDETDRFLWVMTSSQAERICIKILMALAFSLFWPIMMFIAGVITALFMIILAGFYIGARFFWSEAKSVPSNGLFNNGWTPGNGKNWRS